MTTELDSRYNLLDIHDSSECLQPQAMAASTRIDKIMTNKPTHAIISRAKESQPKTIAPAPTSPVAAPYVKTSAIVDAAAPAICCQKLASSAMMEDTVRDASAT